MTASKGAVAIMVKAFPTSAARWQWRRVAIGGVVVLAAFVALWMSSLAKASAFLYGYQRTLKVGMTMEEVSKIFEGPPAYVCKYREYLIIGYPMPHPLLWSETPAGPRLSSASTISEIPGLYGGAQLLFDSGGVLIAYTRNGEDVAIRTLRGQYEGDHLSDLGEDFFTGTVRSKH